MRRTVHSRRLLIIASLAVLAAPRLARGQEAVVAPAPLWDSVAAILQTPAVPMVGYTRFSLPRTDLTVRVADLTIATPLIAGGWVGFADQAGHHDMMGDLVVTPMELAQVVGQLARDSIDVTAIHNHLLGELPRLVYVHIHGHGEPIDLARRVARAIGHTATPLPVRAPRRVPLAIDTTLVFGRLGRSGRAWGNVATVSTVVVPGTVNQDGHAMSAALGYGTPMAIQRVTRTRYIASGNFGVLGNRVQPVLRTLANWGITATALHTHMVGEEPTVYFIHFFADGNVDQVLNGLRAALEAAR